MASLNLSPDPLVLGHNITLEFQVTIGTSVTSGTAHVTLEKKVGIWIEIPCISNIGSCTYDNFCDLFNISKPCGPILEQYKIPCHCPFNSGTYTFPTTSFATKVPSNVPSWLTDVTV